MTDSTATKTPASVHMPDDRPPAVINSLTKWMLTAPGLQRMIGQGLALLSFEGRRSGHTYTIPVSYHRDGDVVTVVTKRLRNWWHNFETPARVRLRLAGEDCVGKAEIVTGDAEVIEFMLGYLEKRPIDARAYGLAKDQITREKVASILPGIVLIRIRLGDTA